MSSFDHHVYTTGERGGIFHQRSSSVRKRPRQREILLAIVGVETFFGEITGKHRVIDALATLAFDYPPRSPFFRGELEQFLLMTREESLDPLQRRLTGIVRENTNRLSRVVEDVLRVARREAPLGDEFELGPFVAGWLAEFERDRGIVAGRIVLAAAPALVVRFEPSHLRQVLFNLVDNALRYASSQPGAIRIFAERGKLHGASAQLSVFDDGPGIALNVRSALFEPFNTSRVGGTGLGLYIAREFCIANQGDLVVDSRRDVDGSSRDGFTLRFGLGAPAPSDGRGFLDTIALS